MLLHLALPLNVLGSLVYNWDKLLLGLGSLRAVIGCQNILGLLLDLVLLGVVESVVNSLCCVGIQVVTFLLIEDLLAALTQLWLEEC